MKRSLDKRSRISRTFVPSSSEHNSKIDDPSLKYFYKIKGNFQILDKYEFDEGSKKKSDQSSSHNRFRLSKRLEQLSRLKSVRKTNIERQRGWSESVKNRTISHRNMNINKDDENYDLQISNIDKTISGTRLGALSALQIMEDLQIKQLGQKDSFYGFDKLIKRMDSDFGEESFNTQSKIKRPNELKRKISILDGGRAFDRKIETIYEGGEGFLEKYRQYQMSLLQKIPSYKSKQLTLDYKNEWRI